MNEIKVTGNDYRDVVGKTPRHNSIKSNQNSLNG